MATHETITALRLRLDALMGTQHALYAAKEIAMPYTGLFAQAEATLAFHESQTHAYHALKMAKTWLGNALSELGETPTPYTVVDTADAIPPTADVAPPFVLPDGDMLAMVNALRAEVKAVYEEIADVRFVGRNTLVADAIRQAWVYAREASNHMGFVLSAMREYAQAAKQSGTQ